MHILKAKSKLASALLVVSVFTALPTIAYQAVTPAAPSAQRIATTSVLSFAEMATRAAAEVPDIREMEVHDLLLEVEGYDSAGRKIKLLMDRHSGAVLSHRVKPDKRTGQHTHVD